MTAKFVGILTETYRAFIADEIFTRGAAIAFYAATSIAPLLLIVIATAGLIFDYEAAQAVVTAQLTDLIGKEPAVMLEGAVKSASGQTAGNFAAVAGIIALIATVSGAFGELQSALNVIWRVKPKGQIFSRLVRARVASMGLVVTLGFLLVVSLAVSALIAAFGDQLNTWISFGSPIINVVNFLVSFLLIALLFAIAYKVLPDRALRLKEVFTGAALSAFLFVVGKSIIGFYLGASGVASVYGAAGSLIILLLWVYYSVQVFLFGAEFAAALFRASTR